MAKTKKLPSRKRRMSSTTMESKFANKDVDWHIQKAEKTIRGAMRAKSKGMDVTYAMQEARTHRRLARDKLMAMKPYAGDDIRLRQQERDRKEAIRQLDNMVKKKTQQPAFHASVLKGDQKGRMGDIAAAGGISKKQVKQMMKDAEIGVQTTKAGSTGGGGGSTTKGGGRSEAAKKAWATRRANAKGDTGWRTIKGRKVKVSGKGKK